ncbi:hypothetical protein V5P93_003962 [Actinokineospora auranticolor]|uniref:Transcriptional regulator n=1 Tax=Actinokineospora auranticolor TaxID=155976 RepID=A0A2S6GM01_9PSEU|nr:hypothetical protein [Actinokineospora auranticolor]PPK66245.1 hypothetical protein CLV40_111209 [Actinokineospora auranticolor]
MTTGRRSRTPNTRLRDVVAEADLTYQALAAAVREVAAECGVCLRTNKSNVEHWLSGAIPRTETVRFLAAALSRRLGRVVTAADLGLGAEEEPDGLLGAVLTSDPLDTLHLMWSQEVGRRRFLLGSAYSIASAALPLSRLHDAAARTRAAARTGHTVGMPEVLAVRDMVAALTELDERHGGDHGRTALVAYLRDEVASLCRGRFHSDAVRREMLSAASRGVHLLGWKHYDTGQHGLAQRYFLQSYALACESEVTGHDGFVMRTMAMQGLRLHRPEHCLGLAETGLNRAKGMVDPHIEALFRVVHAHTLAKVGLGPAARAELDHSRRLIDTAPAGELPFWALTWGPPRASVHSRAARVYETLGEHAAAAEQYTRSATARPTDTYARIAALDLDSAARMHFRRGGHEQACTTWMRALDHMSGVSSVRTRKALKRIRGDIAGLRARGMRLALDLDTRARDLIAAT